jgi:protein O-mannosyl-transferase
MSWKPWQQAAVLAGITFAVFSSTLGSGLVYDARMQILTGDFIHDWRNWPAVLTGRVLAMDVLDYNRPAMLASLMIDAAVWGREPFGYHLTSLLLHVANVLLVWLVIRELTGAEGRPDKAFPALLAACVFVAHPVVAEAVCEPTYREDLLVALFTLSAIALAMRHPANAPGFDGWRALGCTGLCLLAIASKEAGIVAPMLLAAYWAVAIGGAKLVVIAFLAARFLFEPQDSSIFESKPEYPGGSLAQAMLLEPRILAFYAQLILFPVNLCADYGIVSVRHLPLPIAVVVLASLAVAGTIAARHDRRLVFAMGMILLPLVPVANLIPIYRPAADRYLYLPVAGVAVFVACLLDAPWLVGRETLRQRVLVACMAAVALLGLGCVERQKVWASSLALWEDSYRKNPASFTNAAGLGEALREAGRLPEAEKLTRTAILLSHEKRGDTWATLALILDAQGRAADAAAALDKALEVEPRLADPDARVQSLAMERPMAKELERLLATRRAGWPDRKKTGY